MVRNDAGKETCACRSRHAIAPAKNDCLRCTHQEHASVQGSDWLLEEAATLEGDGDRGRECRVILGRSTGKPLHGNM